MRRLFAQSSAVACVAAVALCASIGRVVGSSPAMPQSSGAQSADEADAARRAARTQLETAFADKGIHLDLERGLCSIRCAVDVRDDLLEYLLVNYHGAAHESLLATDVVGSQLNAALLALDVEPGRNAHWTRKDPAPSAEEIRAGELPYDVAPPAGDGLYLYVGWREGDELYFQRVEDLVRNLETGRSMRRQRWVFLGSRMVRRRSEDSAQTFAADLEGNLINISFFEQGNTLLTCALIECLSQSIWLPNAWLIPPRDSAVELVFSRTKLAAVPPELEARFPVLSAEAQDAQAPGENPSNGDDR